MIRCENWYVCQDGFESPHNMQWMKWFSISFCLFRSHTIWDPHLQRYTIYSDTPLTCCVSLSLSLSLCRVTYRRPTPDSILLCWLSPFVCIAVFIDIYMHLIYLSLIQRERYLRGCAWGNGEWVGEFIERHFNSFANKGAHIIRNFNTTFLFVRSSLSISVSVRERVYMCVCVCLPRQIHSGHPFRTSQVKRVWIL